MTKKNIYRIIDNLLKLILSVFLSASLILNIFILPSVFNYFPWITEISSSFLPYYLILNILTLFFSLIYYLKERKETAKKIHKTVILKGVIYSLSIILSINLIHGFLETTQYLSQRGLTSHNVKTATESLKIASFNKWLNNENYSQIASQVKTVNPDLLILIEHRNDPSGEDKFWSYIQNLYDYRYITDCREMDMNYDYCLNYFGGWAIYSKKPFQANSYVIGDRFIEFNLNYNNHQIKVFTVHFTAPTTPKSLNSRKKQEDGLQEKLDRLNLDEQKVIVLGDFNRSPWSGSYKKFKFENKYLYDTSRIENKLVFTWCFEGYHYPDFLCSQLDYIYTSAKFTTEDFGVIKFEGSDHHLIYAELSF